MIHLFAESRCARVVAVVDARFCASKCASPCPPSTFQERVRLLMLANGVQVPQNEQKMSYDGMKK